MARKTIVQLTSDLDGSDADETVMFGVDRSSYEIDLSAAQASWLREAFAPYIAAARRDRPKARHAVMGQQDDAADIRA